MGDAVLAVFGVGHPAKILQPIVCRVSVYMSRARFVFWRWTYKRLQNEAMHILRQRF
jgi:hypothetical protein